MSSISDVSVPTSDSPIPALGGLSPMPPDLKKEGEKSLNNNSRTDSPVNLKTETAVTSFPLSVKAPTMVANGLTEPAVAEKLVPTQIGSSPSPRFTPTDLEQTKIDKGHPERKRRASDEISVGSSTKASDGAADDNGKDDDDDDDDESEEKTSIEHDPERLKAFNMFCRLFVDENLDRTVPISKQPKDKIQAILEACDRQFPEFHGRSRKRIRTYLKSCRRMRRSKENGWEPLRPTPPHLTSAAAEQLLAQACENETNNAKRMRMGLDPLPASAMGLPSTGAVQPSQTPEKPAKTQPPVPQPSSHQSPVLVSHQPQPPVSHQPPALERQPVTSVASVADYMRHTGAAAPTAFRPPHEIHNPFLTNGNGLFRPGFPGAGFQHQAHHHPPVMQHSTIATQLQNGLPVSGPTDLSIKKSQASSKTQLNSSEIATIKQLIAGYRESAAFLYRSADELETLLQQQN
ncbi:unnamed protein product [Owenia fusiformis]|uniref:Nucleolar protein 4 helical domain-containing protein n=1 Tax=Owenia fusiformis TaxID=6347 RepID=A0A8J1UX20_OWEFU|nr:unnamed protein product [Owenia fusiformis]